jgi:hypothetical protein
VNERRGDGVWLLIFLALLLGVKPAADAATPPHHKAKRSAPLAKEATPPLVLPVVGRAPDAGADLRLRPQCWLLAKRGGDGHRDRLGGVGRQASGPQPEPARRQLLRDADQHARPPRPGPARPLPPALERGPVRPGDVHACGLRDLRRRLELAAVDHLHARHLPPVPRPRRSGRSGRRWPLMRRRLPCCSCDPPHPAAELVETHARGGQTNRPGWWLSADRVISLCHRCAAPLRKPTRGEGGDPPVSGHRRRRLRRRGPDRRRLERPVPLRLTSPARAWAPIRPGSLDAPTPPPRPVARPGRNRRPASHHERNLA